MTARTFKVAALTASSMQLAVTWFLFELVPLAGSGFLMTWHGSATEYSLLTQVALGLLRVAPPDPHLRPVTSWWAWLVWGVVLVAPLLTAVLTLRASTLENAHRCFSLGSWFWASSILALAAVVAMGCASSFACI